MNSLIVSRFLRVALLITVPVTLGACSALWPSETATRGAAMASGDLSDNEVLQVVANLNNAENRQAQLAMEQAQSEEVRDVAESIMDDHESANQQLDELVRSGINLDKSPLSRGLAMQASGIYDDLSDMSGSEFDCAYLQNQIELHEMALDTVRDELRPSAEDARVQELLSSLEPHLEQHLEETRETQESLSECTTA